MSAAREAVEAAEAVVAEWESTEATKRAELDSLEERAGREVLTGGAEAMSRIAEQRRQLELEADMAARAAVEARADLDVARREHLRALGEDLRAKAVTLDEEADRVAGKADGLLAELAELEGCEYGPKTETREFLGLQQQVTPVPRSGVLRSEANALRSHGDQLDTLAGRADLSLHAYQMAVAKADEDSEEARELKAKRARDAALHSWYRERERLLREARKEWIEGRAQELLVSADPRVISVPENKLMAAQAAAKEDFNQARERSAYVFEGANRPVTQEDRLEAALAELGVMVELPPHPDDVAGTDDLVEAAVAQEA